MAYDCEMAVYTGLYTRL